MFCPKCGNEIDESQGYSFCPKCSQSLNDNAPKTNSEGVSKKTVGVLMGLFLGLIGLIIGVCMYPSGTVERDTFMKGWLKGFFIPLIIVGVVLVFFFLAALFTSCFASSSAPPLTPYPY